MSLCEIYDDVLDVEYLYELYSIVEEKLTYTAINIANRKTWPHGKKGSHKLFGSKIFFRSNINRVQHFNNEYASKFFNLFEYICSIKSVNPESYYLERIDVNLQHSGCDGTLHIDCSPVDVTAKTYMLMVNPVWEKEWGGKFQLYSEDKSEILEEYDYVPGRIVIFPSNLPHKGLGAKVEYPYVYRYSIVFGVKDLFIYNQ